MNIQLCMSNGFYSYWYYLLGRLEEDDRDHFGKKRLDLAGPLLASQFRLLFRKLMKELKKSLQKSLVEGKSFNFLSSMKSTTITDGMKYAVATGVLL